MEINNKQIEILKNAINIYGVASQHDMMVEEMAELTKSILKFRRNIKDVNRKNYIVDIIDELADVYIMLKQLEIIHCDSENDVQNIINYKIDRLQKRINNNE